MWLELTDSLGSRMVVNMALVVNLRDAGDGTTRLETAVHHGAGLHVVVVRESLDEVLRLMEGRSLRVGDAPAPVKQSRDLGGELDFISDGNEG